MGEQGTVVEVSRYVARMGDVLADLNEVRAVRSARRIVDHLGVGPPFARRPKPGPVSPLGVSGTAALRAATSLLRVAVGGLAGGQGLRALPHQTGRDEVPLPRHPLPGPDRKGPGTMDHEVEGGAERVRRHLHRPLAGSRNLLMKTVGKHRSRYSPAKVVHRGTFAPDWPRTRIVGSGDDCLVGGGALTNRPSNTFGNFSELAYCFG